MSSTAGVKVKFFSITISLIIYNFELSFFPNFEQRWRGTIQFFPSVFHSYPIHSISVLYSKTSVQIYIHKISKPVYQTFIQQAGYLSLQC